MKIGIDISALQGPHRMRGVGSTLISFINNIPKNTKNNLSFVFYCYERFNCNDPLKLIDIKDLDYEIRIIEQTKDTTFGIFWKFKFIIKPLSTIRAFKNIYIGDSRIKDFSGVDRFIQFDQNIPPPSRLKVSTTHILYDLIPYIMESDYLWSYKTARSKGLRRRASLKIHVRRIMYLKKMKATTRRARHLIAISKHTKEDFEKYVGIDTKKIKVCLLGVNTVSKLVTKSTPRLNYFIESSWGAIKKTLSLEGVGFIFFIGGTDPRRKLVDLVAAFNNLRAVGRDIRLVLAGDTMFGPSQTPNRELREYFKHCSYLKDIYFLGFVNEQQKNWLYSNSIAFVYPTVYEGFGLPVLESMSKNCAVITYRNSSIPEIAGKFALYVNKDKSIYDWVSILMDNPKIKSKVIKAGLKHSTNFNWEITAKNILKIVIN